MFKFKLLQLKDTQKKISINGQVFLFCLSLGNQSPYEKNKMSQSPERAKHELNDDLFTDQGNRGRFNKMIKINGK